ncbi:MAG: oligosaccharide repeat unit polymerase [Chitinophagaceae bacterium]|nr:oligosaccharide repeat unit polymerase [Chitinophagaceae bacterium]
MKLSTLIDSKNINWPLYFYLLILTQSIFFIKFFAFPLFFLFHFTDFKIVRKYGIQYKFYIAIITYAALFCLLYLLKDFNLQYLIVVLLGLFVWLLCLINNFIVNYSVHKLQLKKLYATIQFYFLLNIVLSFFQFLLLIAENKTINPFSTALGTSAGDFIKGYFANSSINMIVSSFAFVFFYARKNYLLAILSLMVLILTTYMSGVLIFIVIFVLYFLLTSKTSLIQKIQLLILGFIFSISFYLLSKDNIDYAVRVGSTVVEEVKPRKQVSFEQTGEAILSSTSVFFFGYGMGNFSSRLAFIAGGEYVSWYPTALVRKSVEFYYNHFQLWNYEVLDVPFSDGTANQPFSVFNQFLGEYGFIGTIILLYFYFYSLFKQSKKYSFIRLLLVLLFFYMLLDYWFEFFSVIVVFELIVAYWLKEASEKIKHKQIVA